jgi:hypothetical protein
MEQLKKPAKQRENKPATMCQTYFELYNECMKKAVSIIVVALTCHCGQNAERKKKNAERWM